MSIHSLYATMEKDVQFAFRVEGPLREQFIQACKSMDRPAGQVLREFMREFIKGQQGSLFEQRANYSVRTTSRE